MTAGTALRPVLFDLDGTLLDTAPDMVAALNRLRTEEGRPPLPFAAMRRFVSHGSARLVQEGFPEADAERHERLRQRYLAIYRESLSVETRLFPGFAAVLDTLDAAGAPQPADRVPLHEIRLSVFWADGSRPRQLDLTTLLPQRKPFPGEALP